MVKFLFAIFILTIYSCRKDKILYPGFNNLVVGSQLKNTSSCLAQTQIMVEQKSMEISNCC